VQPAYPAYRQAGGSQASGRGEVFTASVDKSALRFNFLQRIRHCIKMYPLRQKISVLIHNILFFIT